MNKNERFQAIIKTTQKTFFTQRVEMITKRRKIARRKDRNHRNTIEFNQKVVIVILTQKSHKKQKQWKQFFFYDIWLINCFPFLIFSLYKCVFFCFFFVLFFCLLISTPNISIVRDHGQTVEFKSSLVRFFFSFFTCVT